MKEEITVEEFSKLWIEGTIKDVVTKVDKVNDNCYRCERDFINTYSGRSVTFKNHSTLAFQYFINFSQLVNQDLLDLNQEAINRIEICSKGLNLSTNNEGL